jgi:hypothetical protein
MNVTPEIPTPENKEARRTVYVQACSGFSTAELAASAVVKRVGHPTLEAATANPCPACKKQYQYEIEIIVRPINR